MDPRAQSGPGSRVARAARIALLNVVLVAATVALLALVGEAVLRAWPTPREGHTNPDGSTWYRFNPYRPDGTLSYALRPSWETFQTHEDFHVLVRTNALGMRGEPARPDKAAGVLRVLVVGDSFAFGFGVEEADTFAARLGRLLAARLHRPAGSVEVLNAGVPGWSTDDYFLYLRTRGYALDPDVVVVAVMENDVGDLAWKRLELDSDRLPVRTASTLRAIDEDGRMRYVQKGRFDVPDPTFPGRDWLAEHSLLYHWLRYRWLRAWLGWAEREGLAEQAEAAGPAPEGPVAALPPAEVQRGLESGDAFRLRYHRHLARAIERDAAERGVLLFWLTIANKRSHPAPGTPVAGLHDDCAARAPRCLDTLGLFPDDDADAYFLTHDGHWNARGHQRVAEALADALAPQIAEREASGSDGDAS